MANTAIVSDKAPAALGPYSSGIKSGNVIHLSGMLGIDPSTGKLIEGGVEAQARQSMQNICAVLEELGLSPASVLKTTVFLSDLNDFGRVNAIYADFFGPDFPSRSCVEVARLPMDALVEIEVIASAE